MDDSLEILGVLAWVALLVLAWVSFLYILGVI